MFSVELLPQKLTRYTPKKENSKDRMTNYLLRYRKQLI